MPVFYVNRSEFSQVIDVNAWNNKVLAIYNQGKHEEAIQCYDKSLQINPKNPMYGITRVKESDLLSELPTYAHRISYGAIPSINFY
jgi:tetratricopeptide (TPR) repeat protein